MAISKQSRLVSALLMTLLASNVSCQQTDPSSALQQSAPKTVPSSLSERQATLDGRQDQAAAQQWPLVNVDGANNKSTVDVHVPIFFDMVNQADKNTGNHKLDLSVMQGLVTVNKDKARNEAGEYTGPLKVTVLGIPVYTSKGSAADPLTRQAKAGDSENSLETRRATSAAGLDEDSPTLSSQVRKLNEKLASSLSDLLGRLSSNIRRVNQQTGAVQDQFSPIKSQSETPPAGGPTINERNRGLESRAS